MINIGDPQQSLPPGDGPAIKEKKKKLTKAEKKEIAFQKEIVLQKQILRDHLQRELQYTQKSFRRGSEEWGTMIKRIKNTELMLELEDWRKRAWRLVDRKDYQIKLLLQNIDIAEEQHDRLFSMHTSIIDYLTDFCKHMTQTINNIYEAEAYEMIFNFYKENADRDKSTERFQTYYENLMHGDNLISEFAIKNAAEKHTYKKEDIVNDNIVRCCKLRDSAINKKNNICQKLEKVFLNLEEDTTDAKTKEETTVAIIKKKQYDVELEKTKEIIKDGIKTIEQLQEDLIRTTLECQQDEIQLMEQRQSKHMKLLHLRTKNKHLSETTDDHIKYLATESYNVVENLKKIAEYGKHLIGVAFLCRKYQTENEKVVPWPENRKDIVMDLQKNPLDTDDSTMKITTFKDSQMMLDQIEKIQNFLYRAACCKNQCQILRKEKQKLEEENKKYVDLIKTCYEAMTYQKIKKHIKASELLSTLNIEPATFK